MADVASTDQYFKGQVMGVEDQEQNGEHFLRYTVHVFDTSPHDVTIDQNNLLVSNEAMQFSAGDRVVVVESFDDAGAVNYQILDSYRVPGLLWLILGFFVLAIAFGRKRGLTSVLGLVASAGIIIGVVIPQILHGADPLRTCLIASFVIATFSLYLAHGFNKRTSIALLGTMITLVLSVLMAIFAVHVAHLFGDGAEETLYVLISLPEINLQGLLLGGIILGFLGVLDDITTAQSAIVEELKQANSSLGFKELYRRGLNVGREHIASLINTLFMAYVGAALPFLLLLALSSGQPLWTMFNNALIAEEIVRTLVGSACLILAVPITTLLAAYFFARESS